jgi:hypothetical protein
MSEQRIFHVHESVLCKTSAFFQNATKPEWTAPTPRPIDLSDEYPDIFHLYVQWLYSGKIAVTTRTSHLSVNYCYLIQSYVLGEKLMDATFQNAVLQCLIQCVNEEGSYPLGRTVKLAYERTTKHSPLRRLLVDFWVWERGRTWGSSNMKRCEGVEFMNDLIMALLEKRPCPHSPRAEVEPPWRTNPGDYRVRDKDEVVEKTSSGETIVID